MVMNIKDKDEDEDEDEDEEDEEEGEEQELKMMEALVAFAKTPLAPQLKLISFMASCRELLIQGWLSQEEASTIVESMDSQCRLAPEEYLFSQVQEQWKDKAKKEKKGLGKKWKKQGGRKKVFTREMYKEMKKTGCEHVWKEVARRVEDRIEHLILTEGLRTLVGKEGEWEEAAEVLTECMDTAGKQTGFGAGDMDGVEDIATMLERVGWLTEALSEKFGRAEVEECGSRRGEGRVSG